MKDKHIITLFFLVYFASLLNLVLIEVNSYAALYVILKYSVFVFFLVIFLSRLTKNKIDFTLSTLDKLLIILFFYNLLQSFILSTDFKGAFKIFLGLLFIILIQNRYAHKASIIHFYKIFNILFLILTVAHLYYFLLHPFVWSYRVFRMGIGGLNGNEIAGIFTTTFPFCILLIQNKIADKSNLQKITLLFFMLYLYILIFYNGSRFAIFSSLLSAVIIYYFTVVNPNKGAQKINFAKVISIILFFGIVSIYGGEAFFGKDEIFSKSISEITEGGNQEGNLAGRIGGIWVPLIKHVNENSFLLGFGNESANNIAAKTTFWVNENNQILQYTRDIHNFFVTLYVELGFIGFCIFTLTYGIIILKLVSVLNQKTVTIATDEKIAVLCSFIGFTTWLLTANAWYSGGWFILFFYVYFLNQIENSKNLIRVNR